MQNAMTEQAAGFDLLIDRLNAAVGSGDVARVTRGVKQALTGIIRDAALRLPEEIAAPRGDSYARRLLHRDDRRGYTVVAMIWGPRQGTQLHDHAGMWCVECVLQGALDVTQYDLVERDRRRYRFERQQQVRAGVGDAGCLIPPFEYHVLSNPLPDRASITIHVYGGEMDRCNVYLPRGEGWWEQTPRRMHYN